MMNVNEVMMFGVLLVLMFGPDTGPPAAAPSTPFGAARSRGCLGGDMADAIKIDPEATPTPKPGIMPACRMD